MSRRRTTYGSKDNGDGSGQQGNGDSRGCHRNAANLVSKPITSAQSFMQELLSAFGWRFTTLIFSVYFGCKGLLYQVVATGMLPYNKEVLKVDGKTAMRYKTIAFTPWGMKAWFGLMSDCLPIGGYKKKYYMIAACLLGATAFASLGLLPLENGQGSFAALLFFVCMLQQAVVDLLAEGAYASRMAEHPESGSSMVTWVWWTYTLGGFIPAASMGSLTEISPKLVFLLSVPFALQVIAPVSLGYLEEEKKKLAGGRMMDWELLRRHSSEFILAFSMAAAAMANVLFQLYGSDLMQMVYVLAVSVVLCGAGFLALPKDLALCNVYMFIQEALYVQIDGPNFSWNYYLTFIGIIGGIASLIGITIFQSFMSSWKFRHVFWVSTLLRIAASFFDIVIVSRWNISVGLSDKFTFLLGDAIIYNVCYMIAFMPAVLLTSKLCPKNIESTIYALLAGFQNFGQQVAKSIGVYSMGVFNIRTVVPCNFDNLPAMLVFCHMLLPALVIPLTFFMIPDSRLDEELPTSSPSATQCGGVQMTGEDVESTGLLQGVEGERSSSS